MSKGSKLKLVASIFLVISIIAGLIYGITLGTTGAVKGGIAFLIVIFSWFSAWVVWLVLTTIGDNNEKIDEQQEQIKALEKAINNYVKSYNTNKMEEKGTPPQTNEEGGLASALNSKSKNGNFDTNYAYSECAICKKYKMVKFITDANSPFDRKYICDDCFNFYKKDQII